MQMQIIVKPRYIAAFSSGFLRYFTESQKHVLLLGVFLDTFPDPEMWVHLAFSDAGLQETDTFLQ
jgi:hypothetical protein